MRVRIARHPLKGGINNRNLGPTVGDVTQTALSQAKGPGFKSRRNSKSTPSFKRRARGFHRVKDRHTRRASRYPDLCWHEGNGSKSFLDKPFFLLLSFLVAANSDKRGGLGQLSPTQGSSTHSTVFPKRELSNHRKGSCL